CGNSLACCRSPRWSGSRPWTGPEPGSGPRPSAAAVLLRPGRQVNAPGLAEPALVEPDDDLGHGLRHGLEAALAVADDGIGALGDLVAVPVGRERAFRRIGPRDGRNLERMVQPPRGDF